MIEVWAGKDLKPVDRVGGQMKLAEVLGSAGAPILEMLEGLGVSSNEKLADVILRALAGIGREYVVEGVMRVKLPDSDGDVVELRVSVERRSVCGVDGIECRPMETRKMRRRARWLEVLRKQVQVANEHNRDSDVAGDLEMMASGLSYMLDGEADAEMDDAAEVVLCR